MFSSVNSPLFLLLIHNLRIKVGAALETGFFFRLLHLVGGLFATAFAAAVRCGMDE